MVTWAGKELLKNTINTATFHNRILEENEMWKQWEKECGLTMMVSDDDILKKFRKNHQCSKHRKRDKSREREVYKPYESSAFTGTAGPSKADVERWDHSGFQELYPDEDIQEKYVPSRTVKSSSSKQKKKKRHHRRSSTPDNEIWEEFKRYKRTKKSQKYATESSGKQTSSGYDNHIKEWKKLKEKSKKS